MQAWQAVAVGIIPSIGVGVLFWFAMRAVVRADRNERHALARLDQAADTPADAPAAPAASSPAAQGGEQAPSATSQD